MHTALLLLPTSPDPVSAAIRRWMHLWRSLLERRREAGLFHPLPALLINAIVKTRLDLAAAPLLATACAAMVGGMLLGLWPKPVVKLPPLTFASVFQCGYVSTRTSDWRWRACCSARRESPLRWG